MEVKEYMMLTLDLHVFGKNLRRRYRRWIKVKDIARELGISPKTAGKLLAALERLGYVSRRTSMVYEIKF